MKEEDNVVFEMRFLNRSISKAQWSATGEDKVSKILEDFCFFNRNRENKRIREFMSKFFIGYNIDYETYETYKVNLKDYKEIDNFLNDIKDNPIIDEVEAERWRTTSPASIAFLLYTKSLRVNRKNYFFVDNTPYGGDPWNVSAFKRDIVQELSLGKFCKTKNIVINHQEYLYSLVDINNIGIVTKAKKMDIEKYRLETIAKLLNLDVDTNYYKLKK